MKRRGWAVAGAVLAAWGLVAFRGRPERPHARGGSGRGEGARAERVVRTGSGPVAAAAGAGGVRAFLGIPYAAPPVGALRWRAPEPAAAWTAVRRADRFGASCMQVEAGVRLPWSRGFMTQGPISEDCLYLNVWTRAAGSGKKLPVMVWIYGGGFSEGSSAVAVYNGATLARRGVVVVTFNYRVGPLGFLAYPGLTQASPRHVSGNYGLLDQIAALRWVHDNIAGFGGDAANVTIFGQSAGAASVALLMRSPLTQGLFARGITESGEGRSPAEPATTLAEAELQGERYATAMGAHSLAELRALPSGDFAKPVAGVPPSLMGFRPNVDGRVVTAAAPRHLAPLINGMVANDLRIGIDYGNGQTPAPATLANYAARFQRLCGNAAAQCMKLYPAHSNRQAAAAVLKALRDRARVSIYRWAVGRAKLGTVYNYYFDRAEPWPQHPQFGAFHTSEVPYIFGTLGRLHRAWTPVDDRVSRAMSGYWSNFAKNGDPNGAGLVRWPAFAAASRTIMELGARMGSMPLAEPARLRFWMARLQGAGAR